MRLPRLEIRIPVDIKGEIIYIGGVSTFKWGQPPGPWRYFISDTSLKMLIARLETGISRSDAAER